MLARQTVCLRRLSEGDRAREVAFGRFLANKKVTPERLIEGWSEQTGSAVAGRHVLAIQDTSEINFKTKPGRRRGLGEIGKGSGRGVLVHAMAAVDADTGSCLGLVGGSVWTRSKGRVKTPHAERALKDKESRRWVETGSQARTVLAQAAMVTVVHDREGDIYAGWASLPGENVHVLGRAMHDRAVVGGGTLSGVMAKLDFVSTRLVALLATPKREARLAMLSLRFSSAEVVRPDGPDARGQRKTVPLQVVEVIELNPPAGVEPVRWRLLTTHAVADVAAAWQIVDWYRLRWTIEQLFRLMKTHGLQLEDSQLASAEGLIKLAAIAAKAAAMILQLVQARDGKSQEPATIAFTAPEIALLDRLADQYQGRTALQKNPHEPRSLAWASWIIARLGGWNGYPSSKPPGPITLRHGLEYFHAIAKGWNLRDVCIP
jgi:Transposase DDE domain